MWRMHLLDLSLKAEAAFSNLNFRFWLVVRYILFYINWIFTANLLNVFYLCAVLYVNLVSTNQTLTRSSFFAFSSHNINWISLCCNCNCWPGVKCYGLLCIETCSSMGASLVLNHCQYVYYRDDFQSHAELCWILPSMDFLKLHSHIFIYKSDCFLCLWC